MGEGLQELNSDSKGCFQTETHHISPVQNPPTAQHPVKNPASSPQPSRLVQSSPASVTAVEQSQLHPRAFAIAVPTAWSSFLPAPHLTGYLTFRSYLEDLVWADLCKAGALCQAQPPTPTGWELLGGHGTTHTCQVGSELHSNSLHSPLSSTGQGQGEERGDDSCFTGEGTVACGQEDTL